MSRPPCLSAANNGLARCGATGPCDQPELTQIQVSANQVGVVPGSTLWPPTRTAVAESGSKLIAAYERADGWRAGDTLVQHPAVSTHVSDVDEKVPLAGTLPPNKTAPFAVEATAMSNLGTRPCGLEHDDRTEFVGAEGVAPARLAVEAA